MMTGAILKAWKTVKQHIPLIKFRKGGPYRDHTPSATSTVAASQTPRPSGSPGETTKLPTIEDFQLPQHYRRAALDEKEIDAINSGGAY